MSTFKLVNRRNVLRTAGLAGAGAIGLAALAGCGETQVVEVIKEVPVEKLKEVTKEVVVEKIVEKVVTVVAKPAARKVVTIEFAVWGDVQDLDVYQNISADLAAASGIRANPQQWATLYYDKLQTALAGGTEPDVIYNQGWKLVPFVKRGVFKPMDEFINKDGARANYGPDTLGYRSQTSWEGKIYMQPSDTGGMVIFYNKKQFDTMGVTYPKEGWTFDEFVETAKKLSKPGEKVFGYQMNSGYLRNCAWMRQDGGKEWDNPVGPKKATWTDPLVVQNLQFQIYDAINTHKMSPTPAEMEGGANQLQSGSVAMKMEGPWFIPRMQGPKQEREGGTPFDVINVPKGKDPAWPQIGLVHGHTVSSRTKFPDESWEFLKWVASDAGQKRIAEGGRQPGTPDMIAKHWAEGVKKQFNFSNSAAFVTAMSRGTVSAVVGPLGEDEIWNEALKAAFDAMIAGKSKAADLMPDVNNKIQKLLDAKNQ